MSSSTWWMLATSMKAKRWFARGIHGANKKGITQVHSPWHCEGDCSKEIHKFPVSRTDQTKMHCNAWAQEAKQQPCKSSCKLSCDHSPQTERRSALVALKIHFPRIAKRGQHFYEEEKFTENSGPKAPSAVTGASVLAKHVTKCDEPMQLITRSYNML